MRARISVSQACGSMPFILAVTIRLYIAAARRPPPRAMPRKASFGGIVGETHPSVLQEQREARPSFQDVVERLGEVVPTGQLGELLPHIDLKVLDQRPGQRLPNLNAFLGTPAIDGALDLEQRIDPPHDLDRNGRERDLLLAGGLATRMDPTRRFPDQSRVASRQIELVVPVIGVGLQDAGISGQMRLGCSPLRGRGSRTSPPAGGRRLLLCIW